MGLTESIERFRQSFWEKRTVDRPPVGVVNEGIFTPIRYLRQPFPRPLLRPEDVTPSLVKTDYEFAFANPAVGASDILPFSAAWRGVPWLEACCGCPVRYAEGSLAADPVVTAVEDWPDLDFSAENEWFACLRRQTEWLTATLPSDGWVSPSILRGPSDVLAAMRGMTSFYCDLYDHPEIIERMAGRVNDWLLRALDLHFSIVPAKLGGYGHIYGYWAPDKTVVIQEDVLGNCSPAVYRRIFQKYNARIVEHLGAHVLFHLHSTGYRHYRDVLAIPGLAGLEITVESIGPSLLDLVPVFREVLEQSRLMLFVDHGFEQLPAVLRQLPREGLYLLLLDKHIRSDDEFRGWVDRLPK